MEESRAFIVLKFLRSMTFEIVRLPRIECQHSSQANGREEELTRQPLNAEASNMPPTLDPQRPPPLETSPGRETLSTMVWGEI